MPPQKTYKNYVPNERVPQYYVRLGLRPIGGDFADTARRSWSLGQFSHKNDEKFEWTIDVGKQIQSFRRAVQETYAVVVARRMRDESEPDLPLSTVMTLLQQHVHDEKLKETIAGLLDGTLKGVTKEDSELAIRAIRGGTFYGNIGTSMAAWWWDGLIRIGFGSSHAVFPFDQDLFWNIVAMADDEHDFIHRFVLSWAGFD